MFPHSTTTTVFWTGGLCVVCFYFDSERECDKNGNSVTKWSHSMSSYLTLEIKKRDVKQVSIASCQLHVLHFVASDWMTVMGNEPEKSSIKCERLSISNFDWSASERSLFSSHFSECIHINCSIINFCQSEKSLTFFPSSRIVWISLLTRKIISTLVLRMSCNSFGVRWRKVTLSKHSIARSKFVEEIICILRSQLN